MHFLKFPSVSHTDGNVYCKTETWSWQIVLCLFVASSRPQTSPPSLPVTAIYTPPVPTVAMNQNFSCHSTDNVEVTSQLHFPPSTLSSAAEGEKPATHHSFSLHPHCASHLILSFYHSCRGRVVSGGRTGEKYILIWFKKNNILVWHDHKRNQSTVWHIIRLLTNSSNLQQWPCQTNHLYILNLTFDFEAN